MTGTFCPVNSLSRVHVGKRKKIMSADIFTSGLLRVRKIVVMHPNTTLEIGKKNDFTGKIHAPTFMIINRATWLLAGREVLPCVYIPSSLSLHCNTKKQRQNIYFGRFLLCNHARCFWTYDEQTPPYNCIGNETVQTTVFSIRWNHYHKNVSIWRAFGRLMGRWKVKTLNLSNVIGE